MLVPAAWGERRRRPPVDSEADWLTLDGPWECVICVQGALSPRWAARLGGLAITICDRPRAGAWATTELGGALLDQAALIGVLTTLYDLGYPLLAVRCVPAPGQPAASASADTADARREGSLGTRRSRAPRQAHRRTGRRTKPPA
jgi:hypothetical protein